MKIEVDEEGRRWRAEFLDFVRENEWEGGLEDVLELVLTLGEDGQMVLGGGARPICLVELARVSVG